MSDDGREHPDDSADDEFAADLLRQLDGDAAPLRPEMLDRAAQIAGDLFAQAETTSMKSALPQEPVSHSPSARPPMAVIKGFAALSAAMVAAVCLFLGTEETTSAQVPLGEILNKTVAAETLQLRVRRDAAEADVWVRGTGQVRWEDSTTQYRIAAGSRLWRIDEAANSAASEPNPWQQADSPHVDLLALLGVEGTAARAFRQTQPAGRSQHAGHDCHIYRATVRQGDQTLRLEAFVDARSQALYTIAAWPEHADPKIALPLAELQLVARNLPIDEEKFAVATSLSEDGRIGKLTDSQGIVGLRPILSQRWTPVGRQMLIKPGDWLRTDVRGANAAALTLTSQFKVVVGPGTLVELQQPGHLLLYDGEMEITGLPNAETKLELQGPKGDVVTVATGETVLYRVSPEGKLSKIDKKPVWLAGFEGSSNNESLGSLIANVDGRNVPLTVGYHKVNVEIRDQIARTTIEESFVNHTDSQLEGVFYFPLPQDASISGFGMWINGELIEADVVEKQRAREIYETILREKRDPGLLEWTGGNIFKARVFPILPSSEKRIRIVYTQVLPLRANRYTYSYALRSELLQKTPLRELSLEVLIHSALPVKSVQCPTHPVRSLQTAHSAKLEFAAQEYTPTRDFEVVCEVDPQQSQVVLIPHRRGEDGYFLVQLTPPSPEGNWQREMLPDGQPLELLLVCDTSGSMDAANRALQEEFVATVLATLGPEDRFNLAACDVDCRWRHDKPVAPSPEHVAQARQWLAEQISLGWTDLDRMAKSVFDRTGPTTHVLYIGDGIITSGDGDPQAFVNRLQRMAQGRAGTFHAISTGSSFESIVLKSLSRLGGGSVRQIGGEQTPAKVALELLNEIAQPGLRDLQVEFKGLQVAAVYPDKLPNLAAGTQQILIGRYLPQTSDPQAKTPADQTGEIVIRGRRGSETVTYAARVSLKDAEQGNSFIPRLWARAHLDHLLEQGNNAFIQSEIIALSEEFHIITPYTSLLVLETDADRERFGVKRRYEMRDGERFFTAGRDLAKFELLQQQMQRAGDWRLGLRRQVLSELSRLGRHPDLFQQTMQELARLEDRRLAPSSGPVGSNSLGRSDWFFAGAPDERFGDREDLFAGGGGFLGDGELSSLASEEQFENTKSDAPRESDFGLVDLAESQRAFDLDEDGPYDAEPADEAFDMLPAGKPNRSSGSGGVYERARGTSLGLNTRGLARGKLSFGRKWKEDSGRSQAGWGLPAEYQSHDAVAWTHALFPAIAPPPVAPREPQSKWPAEALAISRSLVQPLVVEAGGLEIRQQTENFDPRWKRLSGRSGSRALYSPQRWLKHPESVASSTQIEWCDAAERGIYSQAFQLGRVRKSTASDLSLVSVGQRPYADSPLHLAFHSYDVAIERPADERILVVLTYPESDPVTQFRVLIDAARHVVLRVENRSGETVTSATEYSDHIQVGGTWWPQKIETFDEQNRRTALTVQSVQNLVAEAFGERFTAEMPDRARVRLLKLPLPSTRDAEVALAAGSAGFEHRLVLLLRAALIQKWDEVFQQLDALDALAPDQSGLAWIRIALCLSARRHEEAQQQLTQQAESLVAGGRPDEYYLAGHVLDQAAQIADENEQLRLLDLLQPVFVRQPAEVGGLQIWKTRRAQLLRGHRPDEALALQRDVATAAPWDYSAQTRYAHDLAATGDVEAALAWLRQEINRDVERHTWELDQFRSTSVNLLRERWRYAEAVAFLEAWIGTNPVDQHVYDQYLSALIFADQPEQADALARRWLEEARVERKLTPAEMARLNSAISYAIGQRYNLYTNWLDPSWLPSLETTARFFLRHPHHFEVSHRIMDVYYFVESDESDRLRIEVADRLKAEAATLPVNVVAAFVGWVINHKQLSTEDWKAIAAALRTRWDEERELPRRRVLGNALTQIYAAHFSDTEQLPFLRRKIARAEEVEDRPLAAEFVNDLFNELLTRSWREEYEVEALQLVPWLSAAESPAERLAAQVAGLYRYVDRMQEARFQAAVTQLQDEGHPEKLTRPELAAKHAEFHKSARTALADRLAAAVGAGAEGIRWERSEFLHWLRMERIFLDVRLERNLDQAAQECWTILGEVPPPETDEADIPDELAEKWLLSAVLRERALITTSYLALRRAAPPELVERVLAYVSAGITQGGEEAARWKETRFSLLVALDRPDELERDLREWIRTDPFPAPWQLALGRLLAERGRIDEAITLFETVARSSPLAPADHTTLAGWYLVADRRAQYERAKIDVFLAMEEWQIANWIRQRREPWYRTDVPLPTELDENVLFAFRALFEKSNSPGDYLGELREFYTACRDHRLLQMIPDSVIGRTPQQVYSVLAGLQSNLLSEIRNEATSDEILARIAVLRQTAKSPIDLRALDLLEALLERRAAEVLNQPGPHIDAAVAALRRAFEREWAEGEPRQMAEFLDGLGTLSQPPLSAERLRQLRELHAQAKPGTDDRLFIAWHLAHALFWSHNQREEGLAVMQIALREFEESHPAGWPLHANQPFEGYIGLLEADMQFTVGEQILDRQVAHPVNRQQLHWMIQRRNQLFGQALRADGQVSLGSGLTLYRNLRDNLLEQARASLEQPEDDSHRYQILLRLRHVFQLAHEKNLEGHQADVRQYAFEQFPELLHRQQSQYSTLVSEVGHLLHGVSGARTAVEFLIARFETYPKRFDYSWDSPWQQHGYLLADWFRECKSEAGDLEPRLLKIVLAELRHNLSTRQSRSQYFYYKHYGNYFWAEKVPDFARTAEEVLAEHRDSGRFSASIAEYFYYGLEHHDRAIEIMLVAHSRKLLDFPRQITLCDWLHARGRHAESIGILEPIVAKFPEVMEYRTRLITAYAKSNRPEQMRTLLAQTDELFRGGGRWTEHNIALLAACCVDNNLYAEAIVYYGELIPLHQRTQPRQGIGNGTLSNYYSEQARAYSALQQTEQAVDAAAAAIVAWGPRHSQRESGLYWLDKILAAAQDLDQYVALRDAAANETGQDSPLIRQKIGQVYQQRSEHQKAIAQLRIAAELQPHDPTTHLKLIESYDALQDRASAVRETLALLDFDRHNLELYKRLAQRLQGDETLAERAATSVVEAAPLEAEHHQALAEIRQEQNRWGEAIEQWEHVAKLRALEPTGLVKLAEAQIHEKRWDAARETVDRLSRITWPARFNTLPDDLQRLRGQLPKQP